MYRQLDPDFHLEAFGSGDAAVEWTVLIPFFNEEGYIGATIKSLARQTVRFRLVLIDNGSTDQSAAIAVATARALGLDHVLVTEPRPGKVAALQAALGWVRTSWVATCDADTIYPASYLEAAAALLRQPGCVIAGAYFVLPSADGRERQAEADAIIRRGRWLPRLCHAGGAGQAFCTRTLRERGGFDATRWNLVLEDHEVAHRMMRGGGMLYARDLWCTPSPRKRDRASIRWTLAERILYALVAPAAGDWFFYRFLAGRLRRRDLSSDRIRERAFQMNQGARLAPPHPVR